VPVLLGLKRWGDCVSAEGLREVYWAWSKCNIYPVRFWDCTMKNWFISIDT
jgi:hypothetical protein